MKRLALIGLVASAFIISVSVAYYLIIFLPQTEQLRQNQEKIKLEQQKIEQNVKIEQDKRDYVAKRKSECYSIYQKEKDNWNNVEGFGYNQMDDTCIVRYTTDQYNGIDCDKEYPKISSLNLECRLGIFTKRF